MTMSRRIKAGTIDVSVVIRIIDSTDGTPETGVVFNTSGIDLEYRRELAASTDITEATLAALTTAHADGGFLHIGNGYYRLDLPDAACATGVTGVLVHGVVTGMVVIGTYIELVTYDPYDGVRLGLTALPNAAAEAAGGLYTRGTGAGQVNQPANGLIDVNVERWNATAVPAEHTAGYPIVTVKDGTGTGELDTASGVVLAKDHAGANLATAAALTIVDDFLDTEVTVLQSDLDDIQTRIPAALVGGKMDSDMTAISGDITAADNAEKYFDGTGYGLVLQRTTIATLASQVSFTLTAGSADNDAYNNCIIVIEDATTAAQKAVGVIGDYTGATKTVTLLNDPAIFTMATTDIVTIIADKSLKSTVDNRTLDVSATGEAGLDWANIGSPTTAQNLSATNIDIDQVVASVSGAVGSVTGTVGGNVTGSVGSVASGGITAASIAADAITAAKIADGAIDAATFAAGAINAAAIATDAITAAKIAADAIGASELAADAVTEIQSGLATAAALDAVDNHVDTEVAAIITTLGTPAGASISADIAAIEAQTDDIGAAGAGLTAVPWNAAWDAEVQSEVDDALVANNLDHLVLSAVDTDFATTVHLNSVVGHLADNGTSASFDRTTDSLEALQGVSAPSAASIADAVWDETLSGHLGAGSTGEALNAAGAAGDPWVTALPGAYGAGSAGKIIGDNVNATISSRASQSSLDTLDDYVDSEVGTLVTNVAAILDDTGTSGVVVAAASKTGYALSSAGVQAIWDALTSALTTVGTIGKLLVDNINATISSRSSHSAADVWASATRLLTAGTNIVLAKGTGVTGFNDLSAAQVNAEADTALADYDAPTSAELVSEINSVQSDIAALNNLSAAQVNAEVDTALVDINLDHLIKIAVDTDFPTTVHLNSVIGNLADNGTSASFDRTTDSLEALEGKINTIDDLVDTELGAIKTVTDALPNGGALTTIQSDLDDMQTRLPAALVSGRMDSSVGAMAANTLTASALATDAVTEIQSGLSTLTAAQVNTEMVDVMRVDTIPDSISTDGTQPTIAQALYEMLQFLTEKSVSSVTVTAKKRDGSTTLATYTLDSATTPASITRAL